MKWEHRQVQIKSLTQGREHRQECIRVEEHRQVHIKTEICVCEHRQAHIKTEIQVWEHIQAQICHWEPSYMSLFVCARMCVLLLREPTSNGKVNIKLLLATLGFSWWYSDLFSSVGLLGLASGRECGTPAAQHPSQSYLVMYYCGTVTITVLSSSVLLCYSHHHSLIPSFLLQHIISDLLLQPSM